MLKRAITAFLGRESVGNKAVSKDIEFVSRAYELILQRPLDKAGKVFWNSRIQDNTFSKTNLVDTLVESPEYQMLKKTPFHEMVHLSRTVWVKDLPKATSILDIGGSSPNIEQGALIELGYPHRPKNLFIFDLPPEEQYWGKPKFPQDKSYDFNWGSIHYFHGRAEKITEVEGLMEKRFELIYMGQTIEHIYPEFLPTLLKWIGKHLEKDGLLIFDTPNRDITGIQSDSFIDEDHKIEYTPNSLLKILEENGFSVKRQWGMLQMPKTFKNKKFDPLEIYDHPIVSNDVSNAYLFGYLCVFNT